MQRTPARGQGTAVSRTPLPNRQVDLLDQHLRAAGVSLKRTQLQEAVAVQNGFGNWNQFVASRKAQGAQSDGRDDPLGAMLRCAAVLPNAEIPATNTLQTWEQLMSRMGEQGMRQASELLSRLEATSGFVCDQLLVRINTGRYAEAPESFEEVQLICDMFEQENAGPWSLYWRGARYDLPTRAVVRFIHQAVVTELVGSHDPAVTVWPHASEEDLRQWAWRAGLRMAPNARVANEVRHDGAEAQYDIQARLPLSALEAVTAELVGHGVE